MMTWKPDGVPTYTRSVGTKPLLRCANGDGWRWYLNENAPPNEWYVSVTTALSVVMHQRLREWIKRTNGKTQDVLVSKRIDNGIMLHDAVEANLMGRQVDTSNIEKAWARWLELKEKHKISAEATELSVVSDKFGFGGTFDIVGMVDGQKCLVDVKSGWFGTKVGWQLAAYRQGYIEMTGEKELGIVGIQLRTDGSEANLFKYEHVDWCWNRFLDCLGAWRGLYFYKLDAMNWKWLHKEPER